MIERFVLVPYWVAQELGFDYRESYGNWKLLNESDFSTQEGDTLAEKVMPFNGMILDKREAKKLHFGTLNVPVIEPPVTEVQPLPGELLEEELPLEETPEEEVINENKEEQADE